jgi:hypothetical protein
MDLLFATSINDVLRVEELTEQLGVDVSSCRSLLSAEHYSILCSKAEQLGELVELMDRGTAEEQTQVAQNLNSLIVSLTELVQSIELEARRKPAAQVSVTVISWHRTYSASLRMFLCNTRTLTSLWCHLGGY